MARVIKENGDFILAYGGRKFILPNSYDLGEDEFFLDDDDFEFEGHKVVSVNLDGENFKIRYPDVRSESRVQSPRGQRPGPRKRPNYKGEKVSGPAIAPYNFVGLPSQSPQSIPFYRDHHDYNSGLFHGYIDFDIRTLTPFIIRGDDDKSFEVNGKPTIPGSSVRGMLSNTIEVLSSSKFWSYNNRRIYQRAMFPDGTSANMYYDEVRPDTRPGFIKFNRTNRTFYLLKDTNIQLDERMTGRSFTEFTIRFNSRSNVFEINSGKMNNKKRNWNIKPSMSFPYLDPSHQNLVEISGDDIKDYEEDINRQLGPNNSKDRFVNPLTIAKRISKLKTSAIQIDQAYLEYGVPVFYSTYQIKVIEKGEEKIIEKYSFGHTKNYRIPYDKKIGDHIPFSFQDESREDFREAMFGDTEVAAGKLQFDDLMTNATLDEVSYDAEVCRVLGTPKASYYPAYMKQENGVNTKLKDLYHWGTDDSNGIRGYKFYHHINKEDFWIDKDIRLSPPHIKKYFQYTGISNDDRQAIMNDLKMRPEDYKPLYTKRPFSQLHKKSQEMIRELVFNEKLPTQQFSLLRPIRKNTVFEGGRIRFSNLSKEELGMLLLALELNGKARHKMGYAKPYGLGAIKIENIQVVLEDREKRYDTVFTENLQFNTGVKESTAVTELCQEAKTSVAKLYDKDNLDSFWQIPHIKELVKMLEWNPEKQSSSKWLELVQYMNLKTFKEKRVLPTLDELDGLYNRVN